jgi:glucose dehydrogenase
LYVGLLAGPPFRAFDARIGKVLWVADLTENGRAVPITYEGRSGRQYSSVMAGGGPPIARNVDESRIGGRWHVFARPTPNGPPAVDCAWQGTMCG